MYVSNLPLDTEPDELVERFGKFGVIEEDDEGAPKVKLYAREDGSFSGDALVVYFKEESVDLAVNLLDDVELRLGEPGPRMKVQRAEFGHKYEGGGVQSENGEAKLRKTVDKKKISRRIGKMQKCVCFWFSTCQTVLMEVCHVESSMSGTTKMGLAHLSQRKTRLRLQIRTTESLF